MTANLTWLKGTVQDHTDKHLLLINCNVTSLEATQPIFENIKFAQFRSI